MEQTCFLAKIKHLKYVGKKQKLLNNIDNWIDGYLNHKYKTSVKNNLNRSKSLRNDEEHMYYYISAQKD